MTRDKLENIVRDELYSHCDPLELTIDDKRLVSAILAALEAERVGEVVLCEGWYDPLGTYYNALKANVGTLHGKKGSLIFRPEVER